MINYNKTLPIDILVSSTNILSMLSNINCNDNNFDLNLTTTPSSGTVLIAEYIFSDSNLIKYIEQYENVIIITNKSSSKSFQHLYDLGVTWVFNNNFILKELELILQNIYNAKKNYVEKELLETIFQKAQNSIVITDTDGNIEYANQYFQNITCFSLNELIKNTPKAIKSDYHSSGFYKELWKTIENGNVWNGIFINKNKNHELFYEESTITPIVDPNGEIVHYLKIGKNVTRERLLLSELSDEMVLAKKIIKSILPQKYSDSFLNFDCHMEAYNYLGGDYIYFEKTGHGLFSIALFDVLGHGVSSTLISLNLGSILHGYSHFCSIEETVAELNNQLISINNFTDDFKNYYVTGIFLELNFNESSIKIINCGHPNMYMLYKDNSITKISSNNLILGVIDDYTFSTQSIHINELHSLFLFSDGLIENKKENYLDVSDNLESLIHKHNHESSSVFFKLILDEIIGTSMINDDIAMCRITLN